jgi:histidine ammonia-lyase
LPPLILDGASLELTDLIPLARSAEFSIAIEASTLARAELSRAMVDKHVAAGDIVYGLTTGFGKLKSVAIGRDDLERLQRNLVLSHCCGVGPAMPACEVRIAQVLRLNSLARGHSGVRGALLEQLVALFNRGFVPRVPQQGSVGASGDLAPLAHMAAAYMGHGQAKLGSADWQPAHEVLTQLGLEPMRLAAKEGLGLINGTEIMKAMACVLWERVVTLSKSADVVASLTLEALQGSARPFDARLAELKNNDGQRRTAANVRACLSGSQVLGGHADCDRVQDPYSLRCVPQIHGAFKTAFAHFEAVLSGELNAVTDNPLLFPETGDILSAGMFHGQPLSVILDYLGLALCTLANVSERRIEQLVNPDLSKLPAFLAPEPGLQSGLMITQYTAAALVSENKVHAHPASVDSVPTSANQEDHVSMGVTAGRKARTILDNTEKVLAIEWMCAAQAREFNRGLRAGDGVEAAYECMRGHVAALSDDRFLHTDIEAACAALTSGELVAAVEATSGELAS